MTPYLYAALAAVLLPIGLLLPEAVAHGATTAGWRTAASLVAALGGVGALLVATHRLRGRDSRPVKVVWVVALCLFALPSYVRSHHPTEGWTAWIRFGGFYEPDSLPALRAVPHHVLRGSPPSVGYDGQFYAQVALDPLLREADDLDRALENPCYRARRVLAPALAYAFGFGQPAAVLRAFVLVHGAFFVLLVLVMAHANLLAPFDLRAALVLVATALSCGATTCMAECLPDLPAAALLFASFVVAPAWGPVAMAMGALSRDTGLLGIVALPWRGLGRRELRGFVATALGVAMPIGVWFFYSTGRLTCQYPFGIGNVDWPLVGIGGRLLRAWSEVDWHRASWGSLSGFLVRDAPLRELLTVVGIAVQMSYVLGRAAWLGRRALASPLERVGLVFAALGLCLGEVVWAGTGAAARILMPLAIVFNLLLLRTRRPVFGVLFVAGNLYSLPAAVEFHRIGAL